MQEGMGEQEEQRAVGKQLASRMAQASKGTSCHFSLPFSAWLLLLLTPLPLFLPSRPRLPAAAATRLFLFKTHGALLLTIY